MRETVGRRHFLRNAAAGAAGLVAAQAPAAEARQNTEPPTPPTASGPPTTARTGADFMVDVIKSLGIEYCAANPGSSFRGLQEAFINYGGNSAPEWLTCCHEESSVAMAHGYAKIEGKPMMVMAHGTVGLQHASMAIYNAYCDRVPVYIVIGNILDATYRRGNVEWVHSVQDAAAMVRDYTKWDDTPVTLAHFAESAVRAYQITMTPPSEPVVLVADAALQEEPVTETHLRIPRMVVNAPPQGDAGAVKEAARLLVAAEHPVIVAGRVARTPHGIDLLVELAETLQAPVRDQRLRMNFPSRHPLASSVSLATADVVLGLEAQDLWSLTHAQTPLNRSGMESRATTLPDAALINISAATLSHKSNYQDFGRLFEAGLSITGDAEATLPALIEEVKRLLTPDRTRALAERGTRTATATRAARERDRELAAVGWDASPISTARLSAEIWDQIRHEDWSLVSIDSWQSGWPGRLWDFTKHYQYIGSAGGSGIGYGAPAAVGAALANRRHGRITVNIQCDGDLNYAPGVLWTAAHHRIPLLTVMHNNRAYHQERMLLQMVAGKLDRGITTADIGTALTNPNIDYASIAKGYGVYAEGPISNPKDLGPAIRRCLARVKAGEPALIDAVTQPR